MFLDWIYQNLSKSADFNEDFLLELNHKDGDLKRQQNLQKFNTALQEMLNAPEAYREFMKERFKYEYLASTPKTNSPD